MQNYLVTSPPVEDNDFISIIDELPLWSAPFGLRLLQQIPMYTEMKVLDIGCGTGFPLVEMAQRLGESGVVYGIDPWEEILKRAELKIKLLKIGNVELCIGNAESMPFNDNFFDLLVSNNGLNNVTDFAKTLSECSRVARPGASLIFTMNLENSMMEFYKVYEKVLHNHNLKDEITRLREHIHHKRMPLPEIIKLLSSKGFVDINITEDNFTLRFLNSRALFNHSLIKYWFLPSWKEIPMGNDLQMIFTELEEELDLLAGKKGELKLTIPFATISCKLKK